MNNIKLSVVVPCFNEEDMLPVFLKEVVPGINDATEGMWEIICVDDGSTDNTFSVIAESNQKDTRIKGIKLSRNFGHQPALSTGMAYAKGDFVGFMDCDLQDPVDVLVKLYKMCDQEGYDVSYGIRKKRSEPIWLKFAYKIFYILINRLASHTWPEDAGDFSVINRRCLKILLTMPERSRMLRGLRSWVGLKQGGVSFSRPERKQGKSKYNLIKLTALAIQGFINFSSVPLRLATILGFFMGCFTLLFGLVILINRIFPKFTVFGYWVGINPGVTTILIFLSIVTTALFFCIGIIGEYLNVLIEETKRRPTSVVDLTVGNLNIEEIKYPIKT